MTIGFPGGLVVKKLPANAGAAEDSGLFHGSGRYSGEEMITHSSIFAGIIMDSGAW